MDEAITPGHFERLIQDDSIPVVHRALWALLWEGELRLADLLSIDVRDVDVDAHTIRVDGATKHSLNGVTASVGGRSMQLLRAAIGGEVDGPALHRDGRPLSREDAIAAARAAGVGIHGFRLGGGLAPAAV